MSRRSFNFSFILSSFTSISDSSQTFYTRYLLSFIKIKIYFHNKTKRAFSKYISRQQSRQAKCVFRWHLQPRTEAITTNFTSNKPDCMYVRIHEWARAKIRVFDASLSVVNELCGHETRVPCVTVMRYMR